MEHVSQKALLWYSITHHHQYCIAGGGCCVAPTAWQRWMAHFQSSTDELLESRWIRCIHRTSSTGVSSPVGTRRTTNRQIDVPLERHVRRNITLKPGNVSKNCGATGCQEDFAQWRRYWWNRTSEFHYVASDADISCGKPLSSMILQLCICTRPVLVSGVVW